jgi:hypothetical protein
LRAWTEAEVARLDPPPIVPRLVEAWYAPREIEAIRAVVEVFSHGNYPYLLLATIARLLLEGGSLAEAREAPPTRRELADREALDTLLALVERLQRQSKGIRAAGDWSAASRQLAAVLADHIGTSTWREHAWADAPAWQRNAADHVERIVAGLGELGHDGVAIQFAPAAMRQILGTLLDVPIRRRGDAAGAVEAGLRALLDALELAQPGRVRRPRPVAAGAVERNAVARVARLRLERLEARRVVRHRPRFRASALSSRAMRSGSVRCCISARVSSPRTACR